MSIESRVILKSYFQIGNTPTAQQFANLIDSYPNFSDDGITVYKVPATDEDLFGIGVAQPVSRLGIKAFGPTQGVLDFFNNEEPPIRKWTIDLQPGAAANQGLGIEQPTAIGDVNRFFIQGSTGFIGVGTILPERKLHIQDTAPSDIVGLKTQNMSTGANQGWSFGHLQETDERDGAFSLIEHTATDLLERVVVRAGGNVGINEEVPDVKLHVSRALADPFTTLDLIEGTGITVFGPMTDNLVFDYRGLQARHGEFVGDVLNITATTLNLQRLGGDILIHGDSTFADTIKGIITADGELGLGTITPIERIEIDGAIKIGTTDNTTNNNGAIRFTGTDFEGRKNDTWVSLTAGNGPWTIGLGNSIYYDTGTAPRASVGTNKTDATLTAFNEESVTQGSIGLLTVNKSTNTGGGGQDDHRIGVLIDCINTWGGDPLSKNVGLFVREATGQTANAENLAAVLNGNVVLGTIPTGSTIIGENGKNVLAFQISPTTEPATVPTAPAIQVYAGVNALGASALKIMTAEGDVISLYKESTLVPAADMTAVTDVYNQDVADVIINMRERINNLETKLKTFGLLA